MWPQQIQALYPQCSRVVWECRSEDIESQRRRRGVGDRRSPEVGLGTAVGFPSTHSLIAFIYTFLFLISVAMYHRSSRRPGPGYGQSVSGKARSACSRLFDLTSAVRARLTPAPLVFTPFTGLVPVSSTNTSLSFSLFTVYPSPCFDIFLYLFAANYDHHFVLRIINHLSVGSRPVYFKHSFLLSQL